MSETYIPLSQINTYVFCPRRFYYESVEGHQVINEHIEEGKIKHEHVHTAVTGPAVRETRPSRADNTSLPIRLACLRLHRPR